MSEIVSQKKWNFRKEVSAGNLLSAFAFITALIAWGITQEQQNRIQTAAIERMRLEVIQDRVKRRDLEGRMMRVEAILQVNLANLADAINKQSDRIDKIWDVMREDRQKR